MFTLRFDMRAPSSGASPVDLYRAAINMSEWAEERGCLAVVLCEHHGSADGYLPAPLILASAIAGRTQRLPLLLTVILPLYEPVRLAEEMAVLDLISNGRASYAFGLGYRPEEYRHFGLDISQRTRMADEKLETVRRLLSGRDVDVQGSPVTVTPVPCSAGGPSLMWGGGSLRAARRAGRYGLGYLAQGDAPGSREAYEAACVEHGHPPGVAVLPDRDTPGVSFVAEDVDRAWEDLGPHLLHDAQAYAAWNPTNATSAGISRASSVDELRSEARTHRIFTPEEAAARSAGGHVLNLAPLCGGIAPDVAWPYLQTAVESLRVRSR